MRKLKTSVLTAVVIFTILSSATSDRQGLVEGTKPGDLAPRMKSLENEFDFQFQNKAGRYTLLSFWATYDAESRLRNVQIWNSIERMDSDKIQMISVSLDPNEMIFNETVKIDNISQAKAFHASSAVKTEIIKRYQLRKRFTNFLIDDQGVIVASNITPQHLIALN